MFFFLLVLLIVMIRLQKSEFVYMFSHGNYTAISQESQNLITLSIWPKIELTSYQAAFRCWRHFDLFGHFLATFGQKNVLMDNPRTNVIGSLE